MKPQNNKIMVALYLRGDNLDPTFISKQLAQCPSSSQYKGERKVTKTNHEYVAKIGVWELTADSDSCLLSDHISQLTSKVGMERITSWDIEGIQEAYVDVFIAADADEDGEGTFEFELTKENLSSLQQLGLPIRFTVALGKA